MGSSSFETYEGSSLINFDGNLLHLAFLLSSPCILTYLTIIPLFFKKYIWKVNVPLKIRIFMLFLNKKVILTKNNLKKRNWQGCSKCCFCDQDETIQHLFFSCPFVKIVWRIVYMTFNIPPPTNVTNMFGNCLNGVAKKDKGHIRVGVCALLWVIWTVRNDVSINKKKFPIFYAGYSFGYLLDPYVVLSPARGCALGHRYWVQPFGDGST
jgi:hypothetical protein